jgi:hypothetical protein
METPDITINEIASTCYAEGARTRVYGKPGLCPYPLGSSERAFWIDGWTHFDELNGGGPRLKAAIPVASLVIEPNFKHFFVVPVVEKEGNPALGEWLKFDSGHEAVRAGELMTGDHRGVVVLATQMYDPEDESFYEPISILGDVPEELLGQLV